MIKKIKKDSIWLVQQYVTYLIYYLVTNFKGKNPPPTYKKFKRRHDEMSNNL